MVKAHIPGVKMENTNIKQDHSVLRAYARVPDYVGEYPGAQAQAVAEATDAGIDTTRKGLFRLQADAVGRAEPYPKALVFHACVRSLRRCSGEHSWEES